MKEAVLIQCRKLIALAFLSGSLASQAIAAQRPTTPEETWPKEATIRNSSLSLRFVADKQGLKLASLANLLTRHEYLHPTYTSADAEGLPPPSLWENRAPGAEAPPEKLPEGIGSTDASAVANPFYIVRSVVDQTEVFHAATDFDVISWRATPASVNVRMRGRGILVEAELKVSLAPDRSFWTLSLHNLSNEPLSATVGFPAFARLFVDGPRRDEVAVPWGSGATLRDPAVLKWSADYGAGLSAPFALWHGAGEGLYLTDNSRSDTLAEPSETRRRTLTLGTNEAVGKEYGPALALEQAVRLGKGADVTLGPVVLGTYKGNADLGMAFLAQLRGYMVHMQRPVSWLAGEPMIARHEGALDGFIEGPFKRGWKVALLSGFSDPALGNYASIPDATGGSAGLRKAVAALHEAGGKVLFVLDGSHLSKDSTVGKADGGVWAVRGSNAMPVEENGNWVVCPANKAWRDWLSNLAVKLLRTYGADGIAISGLSGSPVYTCMSRQHGHSSPYAWVWGTRQLFSDMRDRLDRDAPDAALVSIGALDLAREFADAIVADTHALTGYRFDLPLLRSVYPSIRAYEVAAAPDGLLSDRLRAWNLAHGLPMYAPTDKAASEGPLAPRRLFEAYPAVLDARYMYEPVVTPSREILAHAAAGSAYVLMAGNLGTENFTGPLRLPFKAEALEDKLSGRRIEPDASGAFPVSLLAQQASFWRIVPPGNRQ